MNVQGMLCDPGRIDEPLGAQEFSDVLSQGSYRTETSNCLPQRRGFRRRHSIGA